MPIASDWKRDVDIDLLRRKRVERAHEMMERFGLDALVVFEYANGRYLAGLRPLYAPNFLVRQAALLTSSSDEVICFVHQDDTPHRKKTMYWMSPDHVREFPTGTMLEGGGADAIAPIGAALRELDFSGGRVGVDIGTLSSLRNLEALLEGSAVVDGNACLNAARAVKFPEEVELMRIASAVVDAAFQVAVSCIEPGIRECEILAEVMRVFYRNGAEVPQCNLIVCTGDNTAPMQRFAGETMVRPGDIVFMDIGACFNGMFSEATRTVVCGEPNPQQQAVYSLAHTLHEEVIGALTPGVSGIDIQKVAEGVLSGNKLGQFVQKMVIAHGIGVGYAEPPFISPPGRSTPAFTVEEGTVVAVVPTIIVEGVPGGGGVRLEDVIAVGADGPERLTKFPYDHKLLA
jgi:Xaa-Pro dipeptidase